MRNLFKENFAKRRLADERRVLEVLNRHSTEEFTAWEIGRLAYVEAGVYEILMRLIGEGFVVDRWVDIDPELLQLRVGKVSSTYVEVHRRHLYKLATGYDR